MKSKKREKIDKMKEKITMAAVKVYAEKGMQGIKITDIAKEANISYGLVYHYFKNKEDIMNEIFSRSINIFLEAIEKVSYKDEPLEAKLRGFTNFLFNACREMPEFMHVIMYEVIWTPRFLETRNFISFTMAFTIFEKMLSSCKRNGEISRDTDVTVATYMFFGGLEMLLTGIILKAIPINKQEIFDRISDRFITQYIRGIMVKEGIKNGI
ncbi:MAG: TetR/AcrR family transcriptional regulator [Deltaproteobacteria bacterium]|nr:TetR/AcrR family transcriptional regulator [Deltaproteobacteria bacterium]